MKWLPTDSYPIQGFSSNKLIVATEDGNLLCLDTNGKLFAALKGDSSSAASSSSSILSMDCDSRMIICGYQDGSIRVFIIVAGAFQLITNYSKAHGGGVTSICIGRLIEDNSISSSSSDGLAGANTNSHNNPAGPLTSASELFVSGSDDCSIRIWRLWYE
jgi:WD40 repeat protein